MQKTLEKGEIVDREIRRGDRNRVASGIAKIPDEAVAISVEVAGGAGHRAIAGKARVEQQAAAAPDIGGHGIGGAEGNLETSVAGSMVVSVSESLLRT